VNPARKVLRGQKALPAQQDPLGRKALPVQKDPPGRKALSVQKALPDLLAKMGKLARRLSPLMPAPSLVARRGVTRMLMNLL